MIGFLLGALVGASGGWIASRLRRGSAGPADAGAAGPHLLPDPALRWLLRAHGALGVWVAELDAEDQAPTSERILDGERLSVPETVAIDRRLERARSEGQSGAERMQSGTLIFRVSKGVAAGLLLPEGHSAAVLPVANDDLQRLLRGIERRPRVVAVAQTQTQEASLESAGSVGLRLAYQLERIANGEAVVTANERTGVRVIGVSGRADRRLLNLLAGGESALARMARGEALEQLFSGDPLGGIVVERRQRSTSVLLLPIAISGRPIGAAAVWLPSGQEPSIVARAEMLAVLADAAPRLAHALEIDGLREAATVDPLTGLDNRRALEGAMNRPNASSGALICADLDNFKLLNDALGHAAGDAALIHFAGLLRQQIRASDIAARTGGEEFAVWLPEAGLALGVRVAESIRNRLADSRWSWMGRPWSLSASFGVAACPETSRRAENLAAGADVALYRAKKGGRNRVEAAPVCRPAEPPAAS